MATVDFKLPDIGEGVSEGEIVEWFVRQGDLVREDDPMVEVMTDKATVTIGAPCDGRIEALRFEVGDVAHVGQVILTLAPTEASGSEAPARSTAAAATAVGDISSSIPGAALFRDDGNGHGGRPSSVRPAASAERRSLRTSPRPSQEIEYFEAKPLATPATRRLAKDMGVDLRRVRPTGRDGRVTRADVRAAVRGHMADDRGHDALEERKAIVGVRRKIAERMAHATATAAHFTFVEECDASRLVEMRERLAPEAERRGLHLTYLPFIVKAVTAALKHHPTLNSAVDEANHELVVKKYYHVGIATATEAGLVVPVVHHADRLRLFELAAEIDRLTRSARQGSLAPEDLRDSTFTVTSLGKRSGLLATPILNHPEVAILGVHRIKDRPVVRAGRVVPGRVMYLSLSFDHRIVDGHVGAEFAYELIDTLEHPEKLFFEFL